MQLQLLCSINTATLILALKACIRKKSAHVPSLSAGKPDAKQRVTSPSRTWDSKKSPDRSAAHPPENGGVGTSFQGPAFTSCGVKRLISQVSNI